MAFQLPIFLHAKYAAIGNDTAAVSNNGNWDVRLNVSGQNYARIDVFNDQDDNDHVFAQWSQCWTCWRHQTESNALLSTSGRCMQLCAGGSLISRYMPVHCLQRV